MARRNNWTGPIVGAVAVCAFSAAAAAHTAPPHESGREAAPVAVLTHGHPIEPAKEPLRVAQNKRSGKKGKAGSACKRRCVRSVSGCQDIATAMRSGSGGYRDICRARVRACTKQC